MKKFTATAPASWSVYLMNADTSGYEPEEIDEIEAWISDLGYGDPVDVTDIGFSHSTDAQSNMASDAAEYVFLTK